LRLRNLDPQFLAIESPTSHRYVNTLAEAHGIFFLCPLCFEKNGDPVGTHGVICWFCGVADTISPKPGRWQPSGTGIDDLTLNGCPGKTRSVQLLGGGCQWHGYVTDGDAT
jgi:hypothetical protein